MPFYNCKFYDKEQQHLTQKKLFASSKKQMYEQLDLEGFKVISIIKVRSKLGVIAPSEKLLSSWFLNLYELMNGSLDVLAAMDITDSQKEFKKLHFLISFLKENLKQGVPFSESLKEFPRTFPEQTLHILYAYEKSGDIKQGFLVLSKHLERSYESKQHLVSALAYPLFLCSFITLALTTFLIFFVPLIEEGLEELSSPNGFSTLLSTSQFLRENGLLILIAATLTSSILLLAYKTSKRFKDCIYLLLMHIPFVGAIISYQNLLHLSTCISSLAKSGYSFDKALNISLKTISNPLVLEDLNRISYGILNGNKASEYAKSTRYLPKVFHSFLKVAEENNSFDKSFQQLSEISNSYLKKSLKQAESFYYSSLVILIGGIIFFLFIKIIMPIITPNSMLQV
ncbi:MAG: type II secretion system F family protein [Chlamydiales bacterium]|nr:type II secretion system F family protein [Chlamydiales bacterium]